MSLHSTYTRVLRIAALAAVVFVSTLAIAAAQTTVTLSTPATQVTDTVMIKGGASANTNFSALDYMATRASDNAEYLRRALLKFDTQNTIPAGSIVHSAVMTLTVKMGGTDAARSVGVFPVTTSFAQTEATWNVRKSGIAWGRAGGDLGALSTQQSVSNVPGAKIRFDVTQIVRAAVSGTTTSRYTRIALADLGAPGAASYRAYYSLKAVDPSTRPTLTVVYGGDAPAPAPLPPPLSATLRVLQYNTHHGGYGTDGVYSIDRIVSWIVKANPDIVSLQEIEINDGWSKGLDQTVLYQNALQKATGRTWYKAYQNRYGGTSGDGELILSKYPFIATAGKLLTASRSALDTTIDVNGRIVNLTSAHLDNVYQSNRLKEIAELLPWETTLAENRIIVGDLNAWPDTTEIKNITAGGYVDQWPVALAAGATAGTGITHGSHRIDYVFLSKGATNLKVVKMQTFNTADANGVKPSDHAPLLAVFEVK